MRHLVQGRIDALAKLVDAGVANRFSLSMAYLLFAENLVDCVNQLLPPPDTPPDRTYSEQKLTLTLPRTQTSTTACSR